MSDTENVPTVLEVLQDILPLAEQEGLPVTAEGGLIMDEKRASYFAGKISSAKNEIARRREKAAEYVADAERHLTSLEFCAEKALESWTIQNLDGKKKSIKLPGGTVGFRSIADKLDVVDEAAVIAWATAMGFDDALKTETHVLKTGLNARWSESGEVPPGCAVEKGGERFYVK